MLENIEHLRQEYALKSLDEKDLSKDPFEQFAIWFEEARNAAVEEPNGMTLSTVDESGIPSARIVLLKGFGRSGFVFYTNYLSQKGHDIAQNPNVCLVFWWKELQRQVRINGTARKEDKNESEVYFQKRPKGSQIGAWASPQSQIVENRSVLAENYANLEQQFAGVEQLPKPEHWGGYVVVPNRFEFWQGRESRMHDRLIFQQSSEESSHWEVIRLAP